MLGRHLIIRRSPFVQELVTVEEWEYDLGQTRFIRYLRFENGRLKKITTGDYGGQEMPVERSSVT